MNARNNAGGGAILSVRAYPIDPTTKITVGQVVKLSGGKVVAAAAAETGAILGVAAETHEGTADALNLRANGKEVLVADGPDTIFACAAPEIKASAGTATTVVSNGANGMAAFAADDFNGGRLQLVKLAAGSTNADPVGAVREITDFADASGTETFTVPAGGTANAGDVYRVYPPIGFAKGNLDANRAGLTLSATASISLKVVGHDLERGKILLMAKKHALGGAE